MKLKLIKIKINEIYKIVYNKFVDKRGSFQRLFCNKDIEKLKFSLKQINLSKNKTKGTFRGLHYQSKFKEKKIIKVLKGEVIFYLLNINLNSKDYLKMKKIKISEKDDFLIYVTKDYATAYFTLKKNTEILYFMSNYYSPKHSKGINYKDPKIKLKLPFEPKVISKKDKEWKNIK